MNSDSRIFWKYKFDHILFWVFTVLFYIYIRRYLIQKTGWDQFALDILVRNGLLAIVIYVNLLIVMPLFKTKNYVTVVLLLLLLLFFYTGFKNLHDLYLYEYVVDDYEKRSYFANTYYNFSTALFYIGFSMALQFSKEWFYQREHLQKIKIENLNTEINYLKAQINPHFLFNSLNTLYVQIDPQNEEAKETLEKISEMLRYQLYECNNDRIIMEKELTYIGNYIDPQRLRKESNYEITYDYDNEVKYFEIAPLLFIPFIENAFKHLSNFNHEQNVVRVTIKKKDSKLMCTVFNTSSVTAKKSIDGIGLKNVKRRLELLYPDRHELMINANLSSFEVILTIIL
ncbi:MAG: histidine kinase [Ginsengibacter sp.]